MGTQFTEAWFFDGQAHHKSVFIDGPPHRNPWGIREDFLVATGSCSGRLVLLVVACCGERPAAAFKDIYVHKDSGTLDEIYILRLADLSLEKSITPKQEAAKNRMLVAVTKKLDSGRYVHAGKLAPENFSRVSFLVINEI